jgi:formiminotetrahydrofolate cyclodeaminase
MLAQLRVSEFLDRLAAATPTPGGGSAAALAGSLSAALIRMVADLSLAKPALAPHHPALAVMRDRAMTLQQELLGMVDRDAAAYDEVMTAIRMPKGSPGEIEARQAALGRANVTATAIPLQAAESCATLMSLGRDLAARGNRNALSDAGTAVLLAEAGLRAALMNVLINLPGHPDPAEASAIRSRTLDLGLEADRLRVADLETLKSIDASR